MHEPAIVGRVTIGSPSSHPRDFNFEHAAEHLSESVGTYTVGLHDAQPMMNDNKKKIFFIFQLRRCSQIDLES